MVSFSSLLSTTSGAARIRLAKDASQDWVRCVDIGQRGVRARTLFHVLVHVLLRQVVPGALVLTAAHLTKDGVLAQKALVLPNAVQHSLANVVAGAVALFLAALFGLLWPGVIFGTGPAWAQAPLAAARKLLLPPFLRHALGLYAEDAHAPQSVFVEDDESVLFAPGSAGKVPVPSTKPLRSSVLGGGPPGPCPSCLIQDVDTTTMEGYKGRKTVAQLWLGSVGDNSGRPCMGMRQLLGEIDQVETFANSAGETVTRRATKAILSPSYSWYTFEEVHATVRALGAGLSAVMDEALSSSPSSAAAALAASQGASRTGTHATRDEELRHVGIYADTKMEWMQTLLACASAPYAAPGVCKPMVVVTAYATLGLDALAYAFQLTAVRVVVVDEALLPSLAEVAAGRMIPDESSKGGKAGGKVRSDWRALQCVVYIPRPLPGGPPPAAVHALQNRPAAAGGPIQVLSFLELIERGQSILAGAAGAAAGGRPQQQQRTLGSTPKAKSTPRRGSRSPGRKSRQGSEPDSEASEYQSLLAEVELGPSGPVVTSSSAHGQHAQGQGQGRVLPLVEPPFAPRQADLAMIMFTSGTTGLPKGVEITHGSLSAAAAGIGGMVPSIGPDDVLIGYLPLAHVLEVAAEIAVISHGGCVGYASPKTLTEASPMIPNPSLPRADGSSEAVPKVQGDLVLLQPTIMAGVPAVFERICKAVQGKVNKGSAVARLLFRAAVRAKRAYLASSVDPHPFWDWLVFDRVRAAGMSRRIRGILSGGGPVSADTQELVSTLFAPCLQGYGLTETCGAGTVVWANDPTPGRVGAAVMCVELRLADWLEGGYTTTPPRDGSDPSWKPRGEVYISGPAVTRGYYQDQAKTDAAYTTDSTGRVWFATGDIGEVQSNGSLAIIDRKKDLVKLSHGEYVAVGRIEALLATYPLVDSLIVHAEGTEAYTVALAVPNLDQCRRALPELSGASREAMEGHKGLESLLQKEFVRIAREHGLHKSDIPAKVAVLRDEWPPGSELAKVILTESLKLKRPVAARRYKAVIDRLYGRAAAASTGAAAGEEGE